MPSHESHASAAEEYLGAAKDGLELIQTGTDADRAAAQQYALLGVGHAIMHLADKVWLLTLAPDQR